MPKNAKEKIELENKIGEHTQSIAMTLADMAHFIPLEVVKYIAKKNEEQRAEFEEMFAELIDVSHYLFKKEKSVCVFPGVRRPPAKISLKGTKLKYNKRARAIVDSNTTPRHIWCFLYRGKAYSNSAWLSDFELAHLFPHKNDNDSLELVREVFEKTGDAETFFSNFTGAGHAVLLPKGSVRPTDECREIKIVFFRKCLEMYGEKYLGGLRGFREDKLPSWYGDLKWNKPNLPSDWKARMDSLILYRTKFIRDKLSRVKKTIPS